MWGVGARASTPSKGNVHDNPLGVKKPGGPTDSDEAQATNAPTVPSD